MGSIASARGQGSVHAVGVWIAAGLVVLALVAVAPVAGGVLGGGVRATVCAVVGKSCPVEGEGAFTAGSGSAGSGKAITGGGVVARTLAADGQATDGAATGGRAAAGAASGGGAGLAAAAAASGGARQAGAGWGVGLGGAAREFAASSASTGAGAVVAEGDKSRCMGVGGDGQVCLTVSGDAAGFCQGGSGKSAATCGAQVPLVGSDLACGDDPGAADPAVRLCGFKADEGSTATLLRCTATQQIGGVATEGSCVNAAGDPLVFTDRTKQPSDCFARSAATEPEKVKKSDDYVSSSVALCADAKGDVAVCTFTDYTPDGRDVGVVDPGKARYVRTDYNCGTASLPAGTDEGLGLVCKDTGPFDSRCSVAGRMIECAKFDGRCTIPARAIDCARFDDANGDPTYHHCHDVTNPAKPDPAQCAAGKTTSADCPVTDTTPAVGEVCTAKKSAGQGNAAVGNSGRKLQADDDPDDVIAAAERSRLQQLAQYLHDTPGATAALANCDGQAPASLGDNSILQAFQTENVAQVFDPAGNLATTVVGFGPGAITIGTPLNTQQNLQIAQALAAGPATGHTAIIIGGGAAFPELLTAINSPNGDPFHSVVTAGDQVTATSQAVATNLGNLHAQHPGLAPALVNELALVQAGLQGAGPVPGNGLPLGMGSNVNPAQAITTAVNAFTQIHQALLVANAGQPTQDHLDQVAATVVNDLASALPNDLDLSTQAGAEAFVVAAFGTAGQLSGGQFAYDPQQAAVQIAKIRDFISRMPPPQGCRVPGRRWGENPDPDPDLGGGGSGASIGSGFCGSGSGGAIVVP